MKQRDEVSEAVAKVDKVVDAVAPPKVEAVDPERPTSDMKEEPQSEKKYEVSFTVRATLEKLRSLKQFLNEGEYEYDQQ